MKRRDKIVLNNDGFDGERGRTIVIRSRGNWQR